MSWNVELASVDYGAEELKAVRLVLESRWLTMGDMVKRFEDAFTERFGFNHAAAVANCTAALHLALLALDVGPGDEVILPSLTFVATANAVLYAGATPVFADITGEDDLNLSPEATAAAVTPRTKAILAVHYAGWPCAMDALRGLAERHGLGLVEDCAHAPGAFLPGPNGEKRSAGSLGDIGCFSFFSNKNMTTGEGGMLTTADAALAERLRLLRSHGMTSLTLDRHRGHAFSYDVVELGYNYRLDEMRAALGLVQLSKLEAMNARRAALAASYRARLADLAFLRIPFAKHPGRGAQHIFPVLLNQGADRARLIEHLKSRGIQTSMHYPPVHLFSYYRRRFGLKEGALPVTEDIAARELTLPLHSRMSEADVELVVAALRAFDAKGRA